MTRWPVGPRTGVSILSFCVIDIIWSGLLPSPFKGVEMSVVGVWSAKCVLGASKFDRKYPVSKPYCLVACQTDIYVTPAHTRDLL